MLVGYVGGEMDTGYSNACDYLGFASNVLRRPLGHDRFITSTSWRSLRPYSHEGLSHPPPDYSTQGTFALCSSCTLLPPAPSVVQINLPFCPGLLTPENVLEWCASQELYQCPLKEGIPQSG